MTDQDKAEKLRKIIRELRDQGETYDSLGAQAGVSSATIHRIANEEGGRREKTLNKVYKALSDLVPGEDQQGSLQGFASPFSPSSSKSALEKEYESTIQQIDRLMADDSVPVIYKRELLRLISSNITSLENLAEND